MSDLLEECERLSLDTRLLHLPTQKARLGRAQVHPNDSSILQVRYFIEPGFCSQRPIQAGREVPEGVSSIEYIAGGNPYAGNVSLHPTKKRI